ncbi:chemotaxis protein [Streptomyces sp. NBC_00237]|uniref:baeRF3 domain-containing protein n=1 Tax=Streptomyces sp. NBC_00237 TaxID=2975687 RepID=UPI00225A25CF|nr:chemotaxis protein [Streptomyces sp. NBC_00237]MCX5204498.1 chemotaxis protein [Streptomyces sp. NBC_00237]
MSDEDASDLLAELRRPRPYPAVSLTLPTHRHRPENQQDHIRLRNLLSEAEKRLLDDPKLSRDQAAAVVRNLNEAVDELDPEHFLEGLVLYASADEARTYLVSATVPERIVIGDSFLTRNLVAASARQIPYFALILSTGEVRLWHGVGYELNEVDDQADELEGSGFPVISSGVDRDGPPNRTGDHGATQDFRNMLTEADRKLTPLLQEAVLPVVVVGLRQHVATFRELSRHGAVLAADLEVGGLLHTTAPELVEQLAPARAALAALDAEEAMKALDAARSGKRYAAGAQDCWQSAREGRVGHLVVEESVRVFARVEEVEGAPRAALVFADEGGEGVEDDVVDSLVEMVLDADGDVTFVPDGALGEAGGMAAALRY